MKKQPSKKNVQNRKKKDTTSVSQGIISNLNKLKPDEKLTAKALQLEYAFEYGVDFGHRIIQITSDIDFPLFDFVDTALTEMESLNSKGVTIKINSFGGSVYEALAIVGRIKESKCKITTKGYGAIMSAATLILACGTKRKISQYAWFMHHESSYGFEGKHSQAKAAIAQAEREELQWAKAMAEFSKQDEEFWLEKGKLVDVYFDATELLELGVADEII